jgi:hypothetical protein
MEGIPPEELERLLKEMPELAIAPSPLVGVVAVAGVVEIAGLSVEVLSLELRQAGALIHWRCRADRSIGYLVPRASITDQNGTKYRTSEANGGGDERSWSGEIALVPAPPEDAMLSLVIEAFGADTRMRMPGWVRGEPVAGPWTFAIDTRDIRRR